MAIDFPASPAVGATFSSGGSTWQWDGVKWIPASSGQNYVPTTGGTMTGDLTINSSDYNNLTLNASSTTWPGIKMNISASGQGAWIGSYLSGNERWEIDLGNGVAEGSGNVGSNFQIIRFANNGSQIDEPLLINRNTGLVSFSQHAPVNDSSYNAADTYWVMNQLAGRQNRNRIMNGDFRIDQWNLNNLITAATSGVQVCDRWRIGFTQASKISSQAVAAGSGWGVPLGSGLSLTVASAYTVTASDYFQIWQNIEWQNIWDCSFSRSAAISITLSFWAWSSISGTYGGTITNAAGTRSYPFTYSLPAASTWYYITITIPGDTAGTWVVANNVAGLGLHFDLGSGANFRGTAGSWSSNNYVGATGTVNWVGTAGAGFVLANVQLEIGTQATPFDYKHVGDALGDCERYCRRLKPSLTGANMATAVGGSATTTAYTFFFFDPPFRATPSIAYAGNFTTWFPSGGGGAVSAMTASGISINAGQLTLTIPAAATLGQPGLLRDADGTASLTISAEI